MTSHICFSLCHVQPLYCLTIDNLGPKNALPLGHEEQIHTEKEEKKIVAKLNTCFSRLLAPFYHQLTYSPFPFLSFNFFFWGDERLIFGVILPQKNENKI